MIIYLVKTLVHTSKTVDSIGTNTQTYTRVTRQNRMALTGVDAQNNIKC